MFGVAAAKILRCAYVLRRLEFSKEVIVLRTIKWTLSIDRGFTDHAGLVDVIVLEGIVRDAIGEEITVMMAIGAPGATGRNLIGEERLASRDFSGFRLSGDLRQWIREQARFVLRPKNL